MIKPSTRHSTDGKDDRHRASDSSVQSAVNAVSKFRTLTRALTPFLGVSGETGLLRCQQRCATINTLLGEVFAGRKNMLDAIYLQERQLISVYTNTRPPGGDKGDNITYKDMLKCKEK